MKAGVHLCDSLVRPQSASTHMNSNTIPISNPTHTIPNTYELKPNSFDHLVNHAHLKYYPVNHARPIINQSSRVTGIYSTKWTGDQGFFLNGQHVKIRGFCNHESFGGVGMAIPDRCTAWGQRSEDML